MVGQRWRRAATAGCLEVIPEPLSPASASKPEAGEHSRGDLRTDGIAIPHGKASLSRVSGQAQLVMTQFCTQALATRSIWPHEIELHDS